LATNSLAWQTAEGDFVLFLISGGASALCTRPLVEMGAWQALSQALLASGCSIQEFNTVRKQLDGETVEQGGRKGLNAAEYLVSNDSYTFFRQLENHLIVTGQTGTNVNDLLILLKY